MIWPKKIQNPLLYTYKNYWYNIIKKIQNPLLLTWFFHLPIRSILYIVLPIVLRGLPLIDWNPLSCSHIVSGTSSGTRNPRISWHAHPETLPDTKLIETMTWRYSIIHQWHDNLYRYYDIIDIWNQELTMDLGKDVNDLAINC